LAALCGTVVLAGWVGAGVAGLGSLGRAPIEVTSATARAGHINATALGEHGVSVADIASGSAALSDPPPMPRPAAVTPDPERKRSQRGDRRANRRYGERQRRFV